MAGKITYDDKTNRIPVSDPDQQVSAEDMNEIKESVNGLYDGDNDNITTERFPVKISTTFVDSPLYWDVSENKIVSDITLEVPAGSIDLGKVVTLSEGTNNLLLQDAVKSENYAVVKSLFDSTGADAPYYLNLSAATSFNVQTTDTTTITDNPLTFSLTGSVTLPNLRQVNAMTYRTGAIMTNVRAKVTDNATGVVIRYIPSKAIWDAGTGGISFISGDNKLDFISTAADSPGVINLGVSPFLIENGQQVNFEIVADSVNLKGDATDVPYQVAIVQDGPVEAIAKEQDALRVQSTGLLEGGVISIATSTTVAWTSGRGLTVNYADPENPVVTNVSWDAVTSQAVTNVATDGTTLFGYDSAGSIVQKLATAVAIEDSHDIILFGSATHLGGSVVSVITAPGNMAYDGVGSFADFINLVIGPANIDGNVYGANGANLNIDVVGGNAYMMGSNFRTDPALSDIKPLANETAVSFQKMYQSSGAGLSMVYDGAPTTTIDPGNYDNAGTKTAVTAGYWTIPRIFRSRTGSTLIAYGQEEFATKTAALAALGSEYFTEKAPLPFTLFRCSLVVQQGATALNNTAQAEFFNQSSFRLTGAQSASATIPGITSPGGVDSNIQYNDSNTFGGSSRLCYFDTTDVTNVSIHSGTASGQANLIFRDNSAGNQGIIRYDEANDVFRIITLSGVDIEFAPGAGANVGIGIGAPVSPLHVYENTALTDASAGLIIENDGTGDAQLQWVLSGGQRWVAAIDNSDSDKWKLAANVDVGTNPILTVTTGGNVGINKDAPGSPLVVYEDTTTSDATTGLVIEQDGTGNALLQLLTTGLKRWVIGIDNTGTAATSDLVIGDNADLSDASRAITINPDSQVAIGNFPAAQSMAKCFTVYCDHATTASSALIQQAGTGDAILEWLVPGRRWTAGLDNSDSDKWMLSPSNGLADSILTVTTDGKIGLNILAPTSGLHVYEDDAATDDTTGIKIEQDGAGDAALHFLITGGDNWSMGIDQSDAERFKLAPNTDVGSSSTIDCSSTDINFLSGRTNLANTSTTTFLTMDSPTATGLVGLLFHDNLDALHGSIAYNFSLDQLQLNSVIGDIVMFAGLGLTQTNTSSASQNYHRMVSGGASCVAGFQVENTGAGIDLEMIYNQSTDRSYIIDRSASGIELEAVNGVLFLKSATDDILLDLSSNAGRVEIVGLNHTDNHSILNIANSDGDIDIFVGEDDPDGNTSAVGGSNYLRDDELLSNYYIKRSTGAASTTGWHHTILSPSLTSVDNALVTFDGTTGDAVQQASGITAITTAAVSDMVFTSPSATGGCAIEFYDNAAALKFSLIHNDNTNENHIVSDEELTIQAVGAALNVTSGDDITINANSGANLITVNDDFVFSDTATDAILGIKTPSATATAGVTLRNNTSTAEVEFEYDQNTDVASIILHNEVPLSITGAAHDEDDILLTLASQGTNGAQTSQTVSNRTPVGNNTANPGSKHTMVSGVDSDTYIHKGASANNTDWKKVLTEYENTITVAKSGGDYTSVKSAYDSATTPSATNRYLISVYPGVYTEAPISLVPYVDLVPVGSRFSTKIVASTTGTALFTGSGIGPVMLSNLVLDGVTTNAAVYNNTVTCAIAVNDCQITNCQYGIHVNNGAVFADGIGTTGTSSMTNMLRATGGLLSAHSCTVQGGGTFTAYAYVDGAELHLGNFHLHGANITTAVHALGASTVSGNNIQITNCTTAVKLEDTTDFSVGALSIGDLVTNHIEIVDSTVICHVSSGEMDSDKFDFPASYSGEIISFIDHKEGDEGQRIFGELGVGRPERGTESVFGEGDSYTRGMLVYTENTSNVFVDVSEDARSASGSTFTFTGTAADNAIYIASSLSGADVLEHYGIKTSTSTACVIGSGEIVAEYWTGAAWTEFNAMEADSSGQYLPNAKNYFQETGAHQTRYTTELSDAWTKNDPMTLGTSYYWVRFRIETAVTTAPIFEQFKLHTNRAEINSDGFKEGFGSGRSIGTLPWSTANLQAWASSPTNQDLYALNSADGADYDLGVGRIENEFVTGITDKISFGGLVPLDIDTSSPVRIEVYWVCNNATAGDIYWKTSKGSTSVGDGVGFDVGTAPATIDGYEITSTVEAVGASENYKLKRTVFEFDVSEIISRYADGSSDVLTIAVTRDGADESDDYAGNVAIYEIRGTYVKCFDGGHI